MATHGDERDLPARLRVVVVAVIASILTTAAAVHAAVAETPEFSVAQTSRLPAPLERFDGEDALAAIFPSYRRGRSAVREIDGDDGTGPAHVGFAEAKPWIVDAHRYVVVRFEIGTYDAYGLRLCFPCLEENGLAVLDLHDGRPRAVASNYGNNSTADITVAGVDGIALDLAPYRFDARRTMIGVRQTHSSGPGDVSQEWLSLFLERGTKLVLVARLSLAATVVKPGDGDALDREEAAVSIAARVGGEPNDVIVRSRLVRCPHDPKAADPFACDATRPKTVLRGWGAERYRYSLGQYRLVGPPLHHLST